MTNVISTYLAAHPGLNNVLVWTTIWACMACTLASVLDSSLPQPAAGSHWLPVRKVISIVALNFGNACNGRQPPIRTWLLRALLLTLRATPAGSLAFAAGTLVEAMISGAAKPDASPSPSCNAPAPVAAVVLQGQSNP